MSQATEQPQVQFHITVGDRDTFGAVDHVTCRSRVRNEAGTPRICGTQVPLPGDGGIPGKCPVCNFPLPWYGSETG